MNATHLYPGQKRIGLLMQSLRTGGLEALVMRLAKDYQKKGHFPEVIAYEEGELRVPLEESGVPVHCFPKAPGYKPMFSWQLAKFFRERRFDLLHTHHFGPLLYAAPGTMAGKIPLIHTVHSNEHLGLDSPRARMMFATFARCCSVVTTVNEVLATFLKEEIGVAPSKVKMVRNGVDSEQFHGNYEREELRKSLKLPTDAWVVGTVARLEPEKGHTHLLEAMSLCEESSHLVLIGDGTQKEKLMHQAKELQLGERVHFLGNRSNIPELLAALDVFALPSLREGLPLAVLEAMASGLPILGTKVGGVPKLLTESGGGLCVEPSDAKQLADALKVLRNDDSKRSYMAACGQHWIQLHYSQQKMVEQYLQAYRDVRPSGWLQGSGQISTGLAGAIWRHRKSRSSF